MSISHIEKLKQLVAEIEMYIPQKEIKNSAVSASTIGWQLDHSLKVINAVCQWTINSNPKDYKWKFNFWRSVLLPLGYFPRGKAKAPKHVLPSEVITSNALKQQLETAKAFIPTIANLPNDVYFKHPLFNMLTKRQTIRFLEIHTNHHLKIVKDILKK